MPLIASPSDRELVELLGNRHEAVIISRRAYRYATSAALEELHIRTGDRETALILKGAHIIRAHDVQAAREVARAADAIVSAG